MDSQRQRALRAIFVLAVAAFSLSCVSDLMRESDQASVMTGIWTLFRGAAPYGQKFYNYDKHYIVYWLLAACFRVRAMFSGSWSPVLTADRCCAALFWLTTVVSLLWRSRYRRLPPDFAVVCFLLTPTILLNSVYLNAAIISAGFLLLSGALFERRTLVCDLLATVSLFLAVGARGDALLLAPLLIWLRIPSHHWLKAAFTSRITWLLAAGVCAALGLGLAVYSGRHQFSAFFDNTFQGRMLKTAAAYSLFGLGPSLLLIILLFILLAARVRRSGFYAAGAVCLILPALYYAPQLYSPRYLVLVAVSPMLFSLSRRGIAFWHTQRNTVPVAVGRRAILAGSVALLLIGVHAPVLAHPRLTVSSPTLFPSTDGLYPMGAWGRFMLRLHDAPQREIDHNQLLWNAATSTRYERANDNVVHLFGSPMYSYLELAVTLRDLPLHRDDVDTGSPLYSDSRSFMRAGSGLEGLSPSTTPMIAKPTTFVSGLHQGLGILRFNSGGDMQWGTETRFLNRMFGGNEFRLTAATGPEPGIDLEGRSIVFLSREPFELSSGSPLPERAVPDAQSGFYFVRISGSGPEPVFRFVTANPASVKMAVQALPAWMSASR